jgi:hypothetical protein
LTTPLAAAEELRAMAANGLYYPCSPADRALLADLRDAAADLYAALGAGDPSALREILAVDEGSLRTPLAAVAVCVADGTGRLLLTDGRIPRDWLRADESVEAAASRLAVGLGAAPQRWEVAGIVDNAGRPGRVEPHAVTFVLCPAGSVPVRPAADLTDDDREIAALLAG